MQEKLNEKLKIMANIKTIIFNVGAKWFRHERWVLTKHIVGVDYIKNRKLNLIANSNETLAVAA